MKKILYIKANSKPEGESRTFEVSDSFIEEYKLINPDDVITTLDLYNTDIHFLTSQDLVDVFGSKNEESKSHPVLKYAYQFIEADKYVISAPMWNLSIPAILKAYIDYISVTGITFKYAEKGVVGLCNHKKAVYIVTRGGEYSDGEMEFFEYGAKYLKAILGFFGITDFKTIAANNLDVIGYDTDGLVEEAIKKAKEFAQEF